MSQPQAERHAPRVTGDASADVYAFGPIRVDVGRHAVTRAGQAVALPPKTFELLLIFVRSGGRVLTRQELIGALWPDTFVEEANLSFQISTLRKALGDSPTVAGTKPDADGHWIATVPKVGYRFVGPVESNPVASSPPAADETSRAAPPPRRVLTRRAWAILAVLPLLLSAAWWLSSRPPATPYAPPPRVVPLTSLGGWERDPTFSPDGEQVALAWSPSLDRGCNAFDIYVTIVGSMHVRRLTDDPGSDRAPSWSPDGRHIAFLRYACGTDGFRLRIMSALGGNERALADFRVAPPISWSPDGRYVAVVRVPSGTTAAPRPASISFQPRPVNHER